MNQSSDFFACRFSARPPAVGGDAASAGGSSFYCRMYERWILQYHVEKYRMKKRQCFEESPSDQPFAVDFVLQAGTVPLPQFGSTMSAGRTSPSFTYTSTYSPTYDPADASAYAPTYSPTYSSTYSPAYRPSSPVQPDPLSLQYRPTSPSHLSQRLSNRYPAIYAIRPEYSKILAQIEDNDPSLTHVFLKPSLNPLFGHPEYEFSGEPVLSDAELSQLADALAANSCITSLDLSGLALGPQSASLMRSIVCMTSLASLDFRDNGITETDSSRIFKCAADAGMTQLKKLMLCEPSSYLGTVSVRDVTSCAEWARLELPPLPPSADFTDPSDSTALLRFVINSIVANHALASIAISKLATFREKIPLFLHRLACPPPRIVSQRQQQRLLASGGFALLLLRRISSPRVSG
jgi:hypothetical protein